MSENISSSEMTAYWRSKYFLLSNDRLSVQLSSTDGIDKAHLFEEKYNYPLIGRKVSVRAGWFLEQAVSSLLTSQYDSCISLGSGFSLLTYYIANRVSQSQSIQFIDVDLDQILSVRNKRINALSTQKIVDSNILTRLSTKSIDLENAYQSGVNFNELFGTCERPVFIIEGIIYFLSKGCVQWIFDGIATYKTNVIIFDYWPDGAANNSKCFKRVFDSLNDFIPEQIQRLLSIDELQKLCKSHLIKDVSLQEIENEWSRKNGEEPQFLNQDEFIPVRLRLVTTSEILSNNNV